MDQGRQPYTTLPCRNELTSKYISTSQDSIIDSDKRWLSNDYQTHERRGECQPPSVSAATSCFLLDVTTKRHRFLLRGERHQQPLRCLHHEPPNESGHWPCGVQDVAMPVVASRPLRPLTYTAAKQRSL
ncbi:hypothetical protein F2P81_020785 [Scophthalmus maximus]|uniref:Uncharacterized protein n=1 Tax=Scophthalmus maximus TaxID=52904 RepID=A0A6A4S1L4_SCOMX|nr:hypothetical protein F2P81_020785 [Scophthalmus maximus]